MAYDISKRVKVLDTAGEETLYDVTTVYDMHISVLVYGYDDETDEVYTTTDWQGIQPQSIAEC